MEAPPDKVSDKTRKVKLKEEKKTTAKKEEKEKPKFKIIIGKHLVEFK
jgi:hypothetical protein